MDLNIETIPTLDLRAWQRISRNFWGILPQVVQRLPSKKSRNSSQKPLSHGAKVMYSVLARWAITARAVYPSMARLGADAGLSSKQARRIIQELEDYPLIRVTRRVAMNNRHRFNDSNLYELLHHPIFDREGAEYGSTDTHDRVPIIVPEVLLTLSQECSQGWESNKNTEEKKRDKNRSFASSDSDLNSTKSPNQNPVSHQLFDGNAEKCFGAFWDAYPPEGSSNHEGAARAFSSLLGKPAPTRGAGNEGCGIPSEKYFFAHVLPALERAKKSQRWAPNAKDGERRVHGARTFLVGNAKTAGLMWLDDWHPSQEQIGRPTIKSSLGNNPNAEWIPPEWMHEKPAA